MNDEIKNEPMPDENGTEVHDEDEGRPPVDPKNKLYTFLSLLIFAVLYFGWQLIKGNIYFSYALYTETFTPEEQAAVISEISMLSLPDDAELLYARLHRNFDGNCFYAAFSLPEGAEDNEEFPENIIPFPCGDPERDIRMTVYPNEGVVPDYVYGDCYVNIGDPRMSCMIYEEGGSYTAVFRISGYSGDIGRKLDSWEKTPVK
ncbi:MAG: hypothetical protein J6K92_04935 [Oscillospiraceae bacterium]|nr:hypothetical protein [Oscillospiraceae bacterium]